MIKYLLLFLPLSLNAQTIGQFQEDLTNPVAHPGAIDYAETLFVDIALNAKECDSVPNSTVYRAIRMLAGNTQTLYEMIEQQKFELSQSSGESVDRINQYPTEVVFTALTIGLCLQYMEQQDITRQFNNL